MQKYKLTITFREDLLGSTPLNMEIYTDYVASKHPDGQAAAAAELETLEDFSSRGKTGFHRDEQGRPLFYDYVVKGFFKEAWQKVREHKDSHASKLKAGKSKITGHLFVEERHIYIERKEPEYVLERPLRAETMQGPRVALTASDAIPAGATLTCTLVVLAPHIITQELLTELLEYGRWSGLGQWRSGGYGRFDYELTAL